MRIGRLGRRLFEVHHLEPSWRGFLGDVGALDGVVSNEAVARRWAPEFRTAPWFMLREALEGRVSSLEAWSLVEHLSLDVASLCDEDVERLIDSGCLGSIKSLTVASSGLTWRGLGLLLRAVPTLKTVNLRSMDLAEARFEGPLAQVRDWDLAGLDGLSMEALLTSPAAQTIEGLRVGAVRGEGGQWLDVASGLALDEFHAVGPLPSTQAERFFSQQSALKSLTLAAGLSSRVLEMVGSNIVPTLDSLDVSRGAVPPGQLEQLLGGAEDLRVLDISYTEASGGPLRRLCERQHQLTGLAMGGVSLDLETGKELHCLSDRLEVVILDSVSSEGGLSKLLEGLDNPALRILSFQGQTESGLLDSLKFASVEHLDMSNCTLTGPELNRALSRWATTLQSLTLARSRLGSLGGGDVALSSLEHLNLNDAVAAPEAISAILSSCRTESLVSLELQHTRFDERSTQVLLEVMERAAVVKLILWGSALPGEGVLERLLKAAGGRLVELSAGQNGRANDAIVDFLEHMPALQILDLSNLYSRYAVLQENLSRTSFPRLESLSLACSAYDDIEALSSNPLLKGLRTLSVSCFGEEVDLDDAFESLSESPHMARFLGLSLG